VLSYYNYDRLHETFRLVRDVMPEPAAGGRHTVTEGGQGASEGG
jgi:hypothetical protein